VRVWVSGGHLRLLPAGAGNLSQRFGPLLPHLWIKPVAWSTAVW